jgi:hypothetical protein
VAEYTKTILRGFILPTGSAIEAESGLYAAGTRIAALPVADARPAVALPSGDEEGLLESYAGDGTWASEDLEVVIARGGHPDRQGAAFYMEDSDDKLYGWEAPSVLTAFRRIATYDLDDCVLVATDTGLVAAGTYSTGGGKYLRLLQLSSTGAITTTTSYFDTSAYTTRTLAYCPGLVRLPSGRVVCVFVGQESTGYQSIRSIYSDDNGATWALLSPRLIPTTYNSATTLFRRIRAAYSQGQILITIGYAQGITDAVAQLVSYDGGATATIVAGLDGTTAGLALGGYQEVAALPAGGFLLVYIATANQYPYSYRIASAEEPFAYASTQATVIAAGATWGTLTGSFLTDADIVLGVDEAGSAYLTGRLAGGNDQWISFRSIDRGATWEGMGETTGLQAGAWHLPPTVAGSGPIDAGGCWYRGSLLLCHSSQSPVASAGASQQWISRLGGWRSLTMPALYSGSDEADQCTWEGTWLPIDEPQDAGWTRAVTGAPTDILTGGYIQLTTGALQKIQYSRVPAGAATALVTEVELEPLSGSAAFRCTLDDNTFSYSVNVSISTTTITVTDPHGAGSWSVGSTGAITFRVYQSGSAFSLWYTYDGKSWTNLVENQTLTSGGAAVVGTNRVRWGLDNASSSANYYRVAYTSGSYAGIVPLADPPAQMGITGSQIVVRDGLHPRYASSLPAYAWDGLAVALRSGPVAAGDRWTIGTQSPYATANILPSDKPSPRQLARWEGAGGADELRIVVTLDASEAPPGVLVGAYLDGLYGGPWSLALWDGAAWVTQESTPVLAFSSQIMAAGDYHLLRPSTSPGYILRYDELEGAAVRVWTDNTKATLLYDGRVVTNSEGLVVPYASSTRGARIVCEGLTSSPTTARYVEVYPRRAVAIFDAYNVVALTSQVKIKLSIPVSTNFYGATLGEVGIFAAGPVAIFGKDYSVSRNLAVEPGGELIELPGGLRVGDGSTPPRRAVELAWVDPCDLTDILTPLDSAHTPDYLRFKSTSPPVAHRHDTTLLVSDLIARGNGIGLAVYLPHVPTAEAPTWIASLDRARGALYGRIIGSARLEQAVGEEGTSAVYRLSTVTISEEL